jgi:hypothetical protein
MRIKSWAIGLSVCAFIALAAQPSDAARPTKPRIHAGAGWGDCVRTVRALSDFTIRGDAWMWWNNAAGVHERDNRPQAGSVLVFKRTGSMGRGHVSLVSRVVDKRTVLVDHTWIAGRGIKRGMEVVDVSPNNDWSAVRVWHGPTDQLGQRVYPTYGFILPGAAGSSGVIQVADRADAVIDNADDAAPAVVAPTSRKQQARQVLKLQQAKATAHAPAPRKPLIPASPAFGRMFAPLTVSALMTPPPRKPTQGPAHAAAHKVELPPAAVARKPATRVTVKKEAVQAKAPARKPGAI